MQEASPDTRKRGPIQVKDNETPGSQKLDSSDIKDGENTHLSIDINDSMQLEKQGLKRV